MAKRRRSTTDAVEILHRRFYEGKPEMIAGLEEARLNDWIARSILDRRTKAGLSQRQLAARVGTTASVICRLEDADYEGRSLSMLQRIAAALECRVDLVLVPLEPAVRSRNGVAVRGGKRVRTISKRVGRKAAA